MVINNKSVRGIYVYNSSITYEPGDFVINDNIIYVCIAKSLGNDPATNRGYFQIYLGESIATDEDFNNFRSSTSSDDSKDKFISAYYISKILNSYMMGFNEKGLINNYIDSTGSIIIKDYFGNPGDVTISTNSNYIYPLDKIMVTEDINNAIFSVDRSVVEYIGVPSGKTGAVILRQFTYSDSGNLIRIQELIDEENGVIRYRYSSGSDSYDPSNPWTLTTVNSDFKTTVTDTINYYSSKIIELDKKEASIRNSFRFKKVPVSYSSIDYSGDNSINVNYGSTSTIIPYESGDFYLTICTKYVESSLSIQSVTNSNTVWRTDSITLNLGDISSYESFGIVGNKTLTITKSTNYFTFKTTDGSFIDSMYYRQNLDDAITISSSIEEKHGLQIVQTSGSYIYECYPSSVEDLSTGLTLNLLTLYPSGWKMMLVASVSNYYYSTSTSSWTTITTNFEFRFNIVPGSTTSGTLKSETDITGCEVSYTYIYDVSRGKYLIRLIPNNSYGVYGGIAKNSPSTTTNPPSSYITNPIKVVNLYYII